MSSASAPPTPSAVLFPEDFGPGFPVGGKASALGDLLENGFPVPSFFVVRDADPPPHADAILHACRAIDPTADRFAVRSSALGEDSKSHSFAGQFDSFLRVALASVPERCRDVIGSAENDRVRSYRAENDGAGSSTAISAIVQRMVDADLSGVAFTADPVSGDRMTTVISATAGTAEDLVSGNIDGETYRVSSDGAVTPPSPASTLTKQQATDVATLARRAESHFGRPQDIEWAIAGGELFLLQSRPITNLAAPPRGELRIWDNSNIAESYDGVTSPLTYSFASRAYASVYRQFCRIMGVPKKRVASSAEVFDNMLGHIRGRVYYNLVNWYRVLALLPGFRTNRKFMEQMMGVKKPMPDEIIDDVERSASVGKLRDAAHIARTLTGLMANLARHRRAVARFHKKLDEALSAPPKSIGDMSEAELIAHYHDLEDQLLRRWDTPLVNDFFAMIFFGILKKKCACWLGDTDGSAANSLIRDTGATTSLEPPRLVRRMAEIAAADPDLSKALESATTAGDLSAFPGFHRTLTEYLSRFGDRCLAELKLESPTLEDDASPLLSTINVIAQNGTPDPYCGVDEDRRVEGAIASLPTFRRRLFRWILKNARARLRDREQLRFERTRVFGRVRSIMRHLGRHYAERGKLGSRDDVFYLTVEEALGDRQFTPETADSRRREFASLKSSPPPPDRFETRGDSLEPLNGAPPPRPPGGASENGVLRAVAASPGTVTGTARVITDPHNARLAQGEILIARQTDPGWIVLFPAAAGIVVERGSLLSHSAIVAREMGIPAIVSLTGATAEIPDGARIEVDGTAGTVTVLAT